MLVLATLASPLSLWTETEVEDKQYKRKNLEHTNRFYSSSARALTRGVLMEITRRAYIAAARTHVTVSAHTHMH
jgi:hypothetical protein